MIAQQFLGHGGMDTNTLSRNFLLKRPDSKIESVCEVFAISERNDLKIAFDRIQLQVWMQVMYVG